MIKVIRVGLAPERVSIVGTALAALRERLPAHPSLTPLIATGVVDVEPFLVSPFIDGDSLDVALREYGPANMADALPRLRQLADAMDAAAAVGAAHGSLHLRDIVVSVGETVLTGLGIAAVLERVGVRPPVRRPYCAPEVAQGHGISPASDQYSLAAIAHEWLSGRRISGVGAAGFQVSASTESGGAALKAVFARALDEDPDARFPTTTAFIDAIAELAAHAAPRAKASRRAAAPAVEAPRLSFDDGADTETAPITSFERDFTPEAARRRAGTAATPEPPAPAAAEVTDPLDRLQGDRLAGASDPFDVPLHAEPSTGGLTWDDAGPAPAPAYASLDDDAVDPVAHHAAGGDADAIDEVDEADALDEVEDQDEHQGDPQDEHEADYDDTVDAAPLGQRTLPTPDDDWHAPQPAAPASAPADAALEVGDRSWTTWAALILAMTVAVLGGGWLLLQWGTPARVAVTPSSATTPDDASGAPDGGDAASDDPAGAPADADETAQAPPPAAAAQIEPRPSPAAAPAPRQDSPSPAPATRPATRPAPAAPRAVAPAARRPAQRPPAPAAAAGRVLVRSTPAGAEVFVNGQRRGVTPLALRDLAFGAYVVRVVRTGFAPAEERVAIDAGRPARAVEFTLARSAAAAGSPAASRPAAASTPGSLLIESRPSGARVLVDGVPAGVTPVTVPTLAPGPHAVRIERPGFLPITTTARVDAGTRARVAVTLTAERPR